MKVRRQHQPHPEKALDPILGTLVYKSVLILDDPVATSETNQ